jgi:hypothetical protein
MLKAIMMIMTKRAKMTNYCKRHHKGQERNLLPLFFSRETEFVKVKVGLVDEKTENGGTVRT